eukprot:6213813-Pleurochrysis_carterae.AAC.4
MHHFPRVEEWLEPESWSAERVFHDVARWEYDDQSKVEDCQKEWQALRRWHISHPEVESVHIRELQ